MLQPATGKDKNRIFMFGHSIDPSDGDIIKEIITSPTFTTTIYHHSDSDYKQHIANLVRILGQDEVIARADSANPTLIFKKQREFVSTQN